VILEQKTRFFHHSRPSSRAKTALCAKWSRGICYVTPAQRLQYCKFCICRSLSRFIGIANKSPVSHCNTQLLFAYSQLLSILPRISSYSNRALFTYLKVPLFMCLKAPRTANLSNPGAVSGVCVPIFFLFSPLSLSFIFFFAPWPRFFSSGGYNLFLFPFAFPHPFCYFCFPKSVIHQGAKYSNETKNMKIEHK